MLRFNTVFLSAFFLRNVCEPLIDSFCTYPVYSKHHLLSVLATEVEIQDLTLLTGKSGSCWRISPGAAGVSLVYMER